MPQNVVADSENLLTDLASAKKYTEKLRLVKYYDAEQNREFSFLTNAFHISSLGVANLYKNR